jgi:hypothetical protein
MPSWQQIIDSSLDSEAGELMQEAIKDDVAFDPSGWSDAFESLDGAGLKWINQRIAKLRADVAESLTERWLDERRTRRELSAAYHRPM